LSLDCPRLSYFTTRTLCRYAAAAAAAAINSSYQGCCNDVVRCRMVSWLILRSRAQVMAAGFSHQNHPSKLDVITVTPSTLCQLQVQSLLRRSNDLSRLSFITSFIPTLVMLLDPSLTTLCDHSPLSLRSGLSSPIFSSPVLFLSYFSCFLSLQYHLFTLYSAFLPNPTHT